MSKDLSREERLAAQLRANLKRRKAQKKAMANVTASGGDGDSQDLSNRADGG
jgi:hypothetical protein